MGVSALVIGGAGFLGTGIVRELLAAGWDVTAMGRGNKPLLVDGVTFLRADRGQPGALAASLGDRTYDLVVDCAAYKGVDAQHAISALKGKTEHYVFISTDFVYSPDYEGPFPISEDAPKDHARPYATGKLECEALLHTAWREQGFPGTALRPPHIMGAGKELGSGTVQGRDRQLLRRLRDGDAGGVTLLSEGQLLIQPVWNREVGTCIAGIAGKEASFGQVFNCPGPDAVTTRRYYQVIADYLGVPLHTSSLGVSEYLARWPDKAPFARHRIYDTARLTDLTGYRPHLRLEDAIAETAAWMDQNPPT